MHYQCFQLKQQNNITLKEKIPNMRPYQYISSSFDYHESSKSSGRLLTTNIENTSTIFCYI